MFSTDRLVELMRAEYRAMPGLKLTSQQACRLWAADEDSCRLALERLITEGVLHRTGTGKYVALPRPGGASETVTNTSPSGTQRAAVRCPHCQKLNSLEGVARGHIASTTFRCVACQRLVSFQAISA